MNSTTRLNLYVFDTETHLVQAGLPVPPLVCLSSLRVWPTRIGSSGPLPDVEGGTLHNKAEGLHDLRLALLDPHTRIVGHNVAYDLAVCGAADPSLVPWIFEAYAHGRVSCTQIREQLIQLALGNFSSDFGSKKQGSFSMAAIMLSRFGVDISDDKASPDAWRLRYAELDGVSLDQWPTEAREYPVRDVVQTYQIWAAQMSDTHSGVVDAVTGMVTDEQQQAAADFALKLMSAWGVRTNRAKVDALAQLLADNSRSVRDALTGSLFRSKDGSKDTVRLAREVADAYASEGLEAPQTAGGKTSTAKEVLLAAPTRRQPTVRVWMSDELTGERSEQDVPILLALASISADEHNLATYIEPLRSGADHPITARFNVLVESGRTSCGKPLNLQNLPKAGGYRECIEARPGTVFIQADYSGIELVALAQHCLDQGWHSEMAAALKAGRDLHTALAADLLGIAYEEAVQRRKAKDPQVAVMRQAAKQINFGFPGGMGPEKFVATVKKQISKSDFRAIFGDDPVEAVEIAASFKTAWLNRWPEMRRFFADVGDRVERGGGEFTLVQPRSGRLRGGCNYSQGCNSYFQGLTADGMKAALFAASAECYTGFGVFWERRLYHPHQTSPLFGCRPVIEIHDEFIFEAPEARAAEACERMCAVMVAGMQQYMPDVPVKVEPSMFRVWSKNADERRDVSSRLQVWEAT